MIGISRIFKRLAIRLCARACAHKCGNCTKVGERRLTLSSPPPVRACRKYVSPRTRALTSTEVFVRAVSLRLKEADENAIAMAASEMAAKISGPCLLVPVPASSCSLRQNYALAVAIAAFVPGAKVVCAVARQYPTKSSFASRQQGLTGLDVWEHPIIRTVELDSTLTVYFVDNVFTSGATIEACRRALGVGIGLVYADASSTL